VSQSIDGDADKLAGDSVEDRLNYFELIAYNNNYLEDLKTRNL